VADVKAEVNRAMDLDELKKMKETVEEASREVERGIHAAKADFESDMKAAAAQLEGAGVATTDAASAWNAPPPEYRRPDKNWRLKRGATPQWYKVRHGVRRQVQSGAARVARYRPKK